MAGQGGQDNVTGMEKIITKHGQAPVAHFVSGLKECEKKTVVWEVRNIAELLKMSTDGMKENGITFDAGHSIGIPATWYFYFDRNDFMECPANYLELSPESKARLVKASCSISLSCEGKTIEFTSLVARDFKAPTMKGGYEYVRYGQMWDLLTDADILGKTENGKKALKVTLTLKVFSNTDSVKTPNLLRAEEVTSDLGKMLESGDGADVEISVPWRVGGEVDAWSYKRKVHKGILMTRSTVFAKMFAKGSEMVEAKTGKVVIKDLSRRGLDVFLRYLYTEKVSDGWLEIPEEILNSAEKYDLGRLKQYCGRNLISAVTTRNAWEMFQLAKLHKLSFAKRAIAEFVSKNSRAVLEYGDEPSNADEEDDSDTE